MSEPPSPDCHFDSDVEEVTSDEYELAVEDDKVKLIDTTRYRFNCALCNLCLRCGDIEVDCICTLCSANSELKIEMYKDVATHGTSISVFLQHCHCPLPTLPPGQYLPKVKLCSYNNKGCHKKFSNWKETLMGKASMRSPFPAASTSQNPPATPQTRQKPVKSQQAPKKVKVAKSTAKIVLPKADAENDPLAKETTEIKKEKTVT
ncbi:hypothetical protein HDU78_002878 [Chytriomyces hyalinus]|nr:hypothetical protein HDU78_002878 [Chytriomyces hyalinus]